MLLLEIGGWIILSCILMSFIEHQVHEKVMHKKNFLVGVTPVRWRVHRFRSHRYQLALLIGDGNK